MPYYLCKSNGEFCICTSWPKAKAMVHGQKGAWTKRYETREEAETERSMANAAKDAVCTEQRPKIYVDGSAILDSWSACAVFFDEGDARNSVKILPPPHTAPRAELAAILLCLERGAVNSDVMSDSAFVCMAFDRGWPSGFAHQDLMAPIRTLASSRNIAVIKVPGHAGIPGNEAVDGMLRIAREKDFPP